MKTYPLTQKEVWVLSTLLKLPVQQGTVLSEWLGKKEIPTAEEIERWISETDDDMKVSEGLLESLILAAVGQKQIDYTLRMSQGANVFHYAIAGTGVAQYGFEEDRLVIHETQGFEELLPKLIPDWIKFGRSENLDIALPMEAFLLFKQACIEKDIAFILNEDSSEVFLQSDLEKAFFRDNGWMDVFQALGVTGTVSISEVSFITQMEQLMTVGFLHKVSPSSLQIGEAGKALAQALSDPNQISITLGYKNQQPEKLITSVFLAGADCVFRLDFEKGKIRIFNVQSRSEGLNWINGLVIAE